MDRSEYRTKLDEVQKLIDEGNEEEAFFILDSMNWRKVRNVNALLAAGEIYEKKERYAEARDLLEMAHERSPIGRMIIYRLALLCIRLDSFMEASEYYKEFVEIAPHDSLKYIIQYELAKAKGSDDITLISILEELKEHDFLEEWAYELALLYHKTNQVEKCISTCDEIILWYGEGPYVESALELKMIYQPLDASQETKYRQFRQNRDGITEVTPESASARGGEILRDSIEIPEVAVNTDRFNTVDLQAEIKKNIEEIMNASKRETVSESMEGIRELVEEIPFVKDPPEDTGPMEEVSQKKEEAKLIDDTLKMHFEQYLAEEYDGQISFSIPDLTEVEPQIAGQMTIDQVMSDWQKTQRAAEAALAEAEEQELENAKAKAIEQANAIIDRLEDGKKALDSGATPKEVLKQEYYDEPQKSETVTHTIEAVRTDAAAAERKALKEGSTFKIPKVSADTGELKGVGLEVPIMGALGEVLEAGRSRADAGNTMAMAAKAGKALRKATAGIEPPARERWQPRDLAAGTKDSASDDVRHGDLMSEATRLVADVNESLQKEIDRAQSEQLSDTRRLPEDIEDTKSELGAGDTQRVPDIPDEADMQKEHPTEASTQDAPEEKSAPGAPRSEFAKKPEIDLSQTRAFAEAVVALMNEQNAAEQAKDTDDKDASGEADEAAKGEDDPKGAAEQTEEALETFDEEGTSDAAEAEEDAEESDIEDSRSDTSEDDENSVEQESLAEEKKPSGFERIPDPMEGADFAPKVYLMEESEEEKDEDSFDEQISEGASDTGDHDSFDEQISEGASDDGDYDPDGEQVSEETSDAGDYDPDDDLGNEIPYAFGEEPDDEEEIKEEEPPETLYDEYGEYESDEMDIDPEDDEFDIEPRYELTEEEKKIFSYFTPIAGMERTLCRTLNGARKKLLSDKNVLTGNIIIQGAEGSGKTTLATSIIQVLVHETGKLSGNVGRIDGDRLNTKDITKLFDKIRGGCLIIEHAGEITRETALELSAQMSQDVSGVLVILEDARMGVERAMALHPMFSKKFTEKVVIPLLTIDELVNFGKAYAESIGYSIDELGLLAMYDRINLIQRYDHPTNLGEVKEIVDEAIDVAESGGLKGFFGRIRGRAYDEAGNIILQEKDFQGR